jgi:hypothetical protein
LTAPRLILVRRVNVALEVRRVVLSVRLLPLAPLVVAVPARRVDLERRALFSP